MLDMTGRAGKSALVWLGAVLLLAAVALIGCSSGKSAEDEYCDDRQDLNESVKDLGSAITSLNVDNIKKSADQVETDIDDVETSVKEINAPSSAQIKSDFNNLKATIDTLGQGGGGSLRTELQQLQTSLSQLTSSLNSFVQAYRCD